VSDSRKNSPALPEHSSCSTASRKTSGAGNSHRSTDNEISRPALLIQSTLWLAICIEYARFAYDNGIFFGAFWMLAMAILFGWLIVDSFRS
jgi:hypothetical protein